MNFSYNKIKRISYSASLLLHLVMLLLFWIINLSFDYPPKDYVEISFGIAGESGSAGAIGDQLNKTAENAKPEEKSTTKEKNPEVKEVELPKAKTTDDENVIKPADKDKEVKKETKKENTRKEDSNVSSQGQGNLAQGQGSFGFDIEWGGSGTRRIYFYTLPEYPEGVQKEIDIRLRFTIKPDGTVGSVTLLTKADTRLEQAAINSLWQWRFEPLPPNAKQTNQTAVIVFPYRLR